MDLDLRIHKMMEAMIIILGRNLCIAWHSMVYITLRERAYHQRIISCHFISSHLMSCHVMSCMSYHVILYYIMFVWMYLVSQPTSFLNLCILVVKNLPFKEMMMYGEYCEQIISCMCMYDLCTCYTHDVICSYIIPSYS